MVIAILVTITFAGTAFVVFMREASQAAANVSHLAQAEFAARSGLEHAIRAIDESMDLCVSSTGAFEVSTDTYYTDPTLDEDGDTKPDGAKVGWYRYFYDATPGAMERIISYDPSIVPATRHVVTGRKFDLSYPVLPVPRKRGEYVVYVEDLDGKLHANIAKWNGGLGNSADLIAVVANAAKAAGVPTPLDTNVGNRSVEDAYSSTSEIARRGLVTSVLQGKYGLERFLTVYPVIRPEIGATCELDSNAIGGVTTSLETIPSAQLTPDEVIGSLVYFRDSLDAYGIEDNGVTTLTVLGDCNELDGAEFAIVPRPAINVNTAPEKLLAVVFWYTGGTLLGEHLGAALARYLCALRAERPFANRHELEEAIRRATGDDALVDLGDTAYDPDDDLPGPTSLTEYQFNDVLNSIAPVYRGMSSAVANAQSAYDRPGEPGVYEFDGWPPFGVDGLSPGPSQTGGANSGLGRNVTWSTELKFTSRFFHIYVVGRGWSAGKAAGVRRLHAIYDARPDSNPPGSSPGRIIWMRWNLSSRGSVSDITP